MFRCVVSHESVERKTPRDFLEESEDASASPNTDLSFAFGRILAWLLDTKTLNGVGYRTYILAYKLRPDLVGGMTLGEIAAILGHGRSASHKLSKELEQVFGIHGLNDRSEASRKKYREAWQRTNSPT